MKLERERGAAVWLLIGVLATTTGCAKAPTDAQLRQQIQAKLSQDSGLQEKSITVETAAGVVTLSGQVDDDGQRTAAARYAAATPGIKEVVNNLQVGAAVAPPPPVQTAKAAPAKKIRAETKPEAGVGRRRTAKVSYGRDSSGGDSSGRDPSGRYPSEWDADTKPASGNGSAEASSSPVASADAGAAPPAPPAAAAAATIAPPAPPAKILTIQSGTSMAVRLVDSIDSETAQQGQTFRATLDAPLSANGETAIPSGYKVEGHVVEVKSAGKFAGQSLVVLQLDRISAGGKSYSVQTDQYRRQGNNRTTNTAEKVGAGAAIGAVLGGIFGGGKGAGIGAAAGGGLGGGVQAAGKGQQIKLASESVLTFTLQSPLTVTQVEKGPEAGRPKLDTPQ